MAWYNPLSWSDKAIDNVLDKDDGLLANVGSWIGAQQYTTEEEAEAREALRKGVVDYAINSMGENSERSKARREIAKQWIKVQLWLVMLTAISIPLNESIAKSYFELATSSIMLGGTGAIITFFFGSYLLTRHNESKK
jgi:hypothetical protein